MRQWYVEFHGPNATDELGTLVHATNGDEAIDVARAEVSATLADPMRADTLDDVSPLEFASWRARSVAIWTRTA